MTKHKDELTNEPDHETNINNDKISLSHKQVVAPSKDIEMQTAALLNSKMLAVTLCLSSKRQAAPPEEGEELAKMTRLRARRHKWGSKNKLCCFCLTDIPTATVQCRHCMSVLNHTEWRCRGGRHISTAS